MARVGSRIAGWVLAGAVALVTTALPAGAAGAAPAPYPPSQCATLSVSTTTPRAGEPMTVGGTGFTPGETVTLTLESTPRTVGSATVHADGTFSTEITIPEDMYGRHVLVATGGEPSCPVDPITLQISASGAAGSSIGAGASGSGGSGLSSTGVQIALLLAIAALAVVAGAALTRAGRARRARG